jgi:S1-C subfamily serine protease
MRTIKYFGQAALTMACATGLLLSQQTSSPIDAGQIYKRISPAVVLIEAVDSQGKTFGQGTGFLISGDGRILTNFHVIAHTKRATVRLANGDAYDDVAVLSIDKRKDIALLKIKALEVPVAPLGRSSAVEIGTPVYAVSNPLGLQNTFSQGLVSGVRQFDGYRYFQITAPISPGSSGGPVIGTNGTVVGIAVGSIEGGQNLNFAIPIDYAKGMLASTRAVPLESVYEPPPAPAPSKTQVESARSQNAEQEPGAGSAAAVSESLPEVARRNLAAFLVAKLGQWKSADAARVLGKPLREYSTEGQRPMKKLEYGDPTNLWRGVRLTFEFGTDLLLAVSTYPWNMTMSQMKVHWGENFNTFRIEKEGLIGYAYVDRPLLVTANDLGAVDSITTYVQGAQLLPNFGFPSTATARPGSDPNPIPADVPKDAVLDLNLIKAKIGIWTVEDAIREYGQPYHRSIFAGKKRSDDWEVCSFLDRTGTVRRIQLGFKADSKRLISITVYPFAMPWTDVADQLGPKFKVERKADGRTQHVYRNKPVWARVDPSGYVVVFSITESTLAWQVLTGEDARNDWRIRLRKPTRKSPTPVGNQPGHEFADQRNKKVLLIERSLGRWSIEDARAEFGPPVTQEAFGTRADNTDGDNYVFRDHFGHFVVVSLLFYRGSNKLVSASLAPAGMTREQLLNLFGEDFVESAGANGDRQYRYRDRPVIATLDKMGNVAMLLLSLQI